MEHVKGQVKETLRILEEKAKDRKDNPGKPLIQLFKDDPLLCNECRDMGWTYVVDSQGVKRTKQCRCVIERAARGTIQRLIPQRFQEVDLLSIEPQEYLSLAIPMEKQREVLVDLKSDPVKARSFMGPTGVGKTFLMCALAKEAILNRRRVYFTKMNVLVRNLRDEEFNRLPEEKEKELISIENLKPDEWGRPTHIYIDEFDKVPGFKDVYPRVFDLVDFCYTTESHARLFTTTNLGPEEFVEEWGAALYRRIQEISPFIHLYRE